MPRGASLGLIFGLVVGLFAGLFVFLALTAFPSFSSPLGTSYFSDGNGVQKSAFIMSIIAFFIYGLVSVIIFVLSAVIYNVVSRLGAPIHLDLFEYEKPMPKP